MIEVKDLTFRYPAGSSSKAADAPPTLNDLSFAVAAGEVFGFLGPSGAGKSTTQKILYRLLEGYGGSVRIAGRDLRDWDTSLYALMGIGFETPNLYTRLTGRENLLFASALRRGGDRGGSDRGDDKPNGVKRTGDGQDASPGLDDAVARLGLEEAIDTRVETWSKGMRMRLAFIRAVLHRPPLLFLDEPTSGLDPFWARKVKDWILELRAGGAAVFVTTHSMELADELCDAVGFLVEGDLVAQESPQVLKQRYGRPGITVYGLDAGGMPRTADLEYPRLLEGPVAGFSSITRVVNREVNLEQVFLAVTGKSLGGPS
jgi:fluoroquinolone transport system ATP-binding protein